MNPHSISKTSALMFYISVCRRGTRRVARVTLAGLLVVVLLVLGGVSTAIAAGPAPDLTLRLIALPSRLEPSTLVKAGEEDFQEILVTNNGDAATATSEATPLVIHDTPLSGLLVNAINGKEWGASKTSLEDCTPEGSTEPPSCSVTQPIEPGETVRVRANVAATVASGTAVSQVLVEEGGSQIASAKFETPISAEAAPSAIETFAFQATSASGSQETQAGGHPSEQTTSFELMSNLGSSAEEQFRPTRNPQVISITLPNGFVGDPLDAPRCSLKALEAASRENGEIVPPCPKGSRIGTITLSSGRGGGAHNTLDGESEVSAIYNLLPEHGYPAELGFNFIGNYVVVFYANLIYTEGGYRLRIAVPGVPVIDLTGADVTLFGDPDVHNGEPNTHGAFLTNPAQCTTEPLNAKLEVNSWEEPNSWLSAKSTAYPHIEGCEYLNFTPEITVNPEQTPVDTQPNTVQADSPDGYEIAIKVPHAESPFSVLSSPELKGATVTLPQGVSISPSAGNGLEGCQATGLDGIDMPTGTHINPETGQPEANHPDEAGEGEAIGPDGLSELTAGHCPSASKIGDVEITTPLLERPLTGSLFIAQPKCGGAGQPACTQASATNGELYGLYLEAVGSGVVVKLAGNVSANPTTGQLTTTFQENPELPVSEIKLELNGGPRAPLASPQSCGTASTSTVLEPWSAPVTPNAEPASSFGVVGCGASMAFAPAFTAGSVSPVAGAYSPLVLALSRQDGEQDLQSLTTTLPPGLLGKLAGVPQCANAEASTGTCPQSSELGTVTVAAGSGASPYTVQGHIYLTGPYNDGPFGEVVEVPAVAGPFNLGTVVVRGSIRINPSTAQATVISDAFPTILDGVPLRVKTIHVTLNRPGFTFNPTNCTQQQLTATITAQQGASVNVTSPFTATGCKALPFKPTFTATTTGQASKADGTSLTVKITSKGGPGTSGEEANIKSVKVDLPVKLPSRLTTLQKACTEAQFNTNPASCPKESDVGTATAHTPVLANPLIGPAYLVSHGGEAFPDLEIVLQGEGITLILDGNTNIKKGITSSTFKTVPDAPISSFELKLPTGKFSILTTNLPQSAHYNLCGQTLNMPTAITGQNGATLNESTTIEVEGCSRSISVSSHTVNKRTLTLSVYVPSAGELATSGKGVSRGSKTAKGRELITVNLKQKKAGQLKTKIKLTFTPSKGKKQTKSLSIAFKK